MVRFQLTVMRRTHASFDKIMCKYARLYYKRQHMTVVRRYMQMCLMCPMCLHVGGLEPPPSMTAVSNTAAGNEQPDAAAANAIEGDFHCIWH